MHPRNKIRMLAGLTIDPSLETRAEYEKLAEAREVPRRRADLKPRNEKTLKAQVTGIRKAIAHLENAVKALESIPAIDFGGDVPHYIREIEELLSTDGGEAGLKQLLKAWEAEIATTQPTDESVVESHFKRGEMIKDKDGYDWKVLGWTGSGDNEVYELECPRSGKKSKKKYSELKKLDEMVSYEDENDPAADVHGVEPTAKREERLQSFKSDLNQGDRVLYDNGIWVVHIADAKADLVGIVPAGMAHATKEEKDHAMQQVKREKLRKPSEEECEVMMSESVRRPTSVTDFEGKGQKDLGGTRKELLAKYAKTKDAKDAEKARKAGATQKELQAALKESTLNYTKSNALSYEDNETDPANIVAQDSKSWANSLNPEYVKNEYTNQLDQRGDQSMDDYVNKVKVPNKVKQALKDAIAEFERDAEKLGSGHTASETKELYTNTAAAFNQILDMLNSGSIQDVKRAQVFATSLMGPMLHKLPDVVWDFISNGGQKRSLKDYMLKVK
jgi:hypothetical protein